MAAIEARFTPPPDGSVTCPSSTAVVSCPHARAAQQAQRVSNLDSIMISYEPLVRPSLAEVASSVNNKEILLFEGYGPCKLEALERGRNLPEGVVHMRLRRSALLILVCLLLSLAALIYPIYVI